MPLGLSTPNVPVPFVGPSGLWHGIRGSDRAELALGPAGGRPGARQSSTITVGAIGRRGRGRGRRKQEQPNIVVDEELEELKSNYDYIYGIYPVLFALRSKRRKVNRVLKQRAKTDSNLGAVKDLTARHELRGLLADCDEIEDYNKFQLNQLAATQGHQGFVLECLPYTPPSLEALPERTDGALWVAMAGVSNEPLLGSMIRTATFFGAAGVICDADTTKLTGQVSKTSAGAAELLPVYSCEDLPALLQGAKSDGWHVLGSGHVKGGDAHEAESWDCGQLAKKFAREGDRSAVIVFDHHSKGMSEGLAEACSAFLRIDGPKGSRSKPFDALHHDVSAGIALQALRFALVPEKEPQSV